jgi:universal stress protein E
VANILAVIDPREESHHALERCKQLPSTTNLDIHAALFIENQSAEKFKAKFTESKEWLERQVAPYIADGYRVTSEVVPFDTLYESVIEVAKKQKADFIAKPMRQHSLFQTVVRTSTDWNLIRHCPYPLLLASDLDTTTNKPILAAVDVRSGDDNHEALNEIVMQQAQLLRAFLGGQVEIVNSWRASTPMMAVGSVDTTPYPTPSDLHKEHVQSARELAAKHNIPEDRVHVEEGSPAIAINQVAANIGAGVIVMGTVARTGISGAIIGNTAEGVLEATNCDVMVVKLPE